MSDCYGRPIVCGGVAVAAVWSGTSTREGLTMTVQCYEVVAVCHRTGRADAPYYRNTGQPMALASLWRFAADGWPVCVADAGMVDVPSWSRERVVAV